MSNKGAAKVRHGNILRKERNMKRLHKEFNTCSYPNLGAYVPLSLGKKIVLPE